MVRTHALCLDTHAVVWLAGGRFEKIGKEAQTLISVGSLVVSPAVRLELQFLYEVGRVVAPAADMLGTVKRAFDLSIASDSFDEVVTAAIVENWTRDPFDRLIVAHARLLGATLLSRDRRIAQAYAKTLW